MNKAERDDSVFQKPAPPKNAQQLFSWPFFSWPFEEWDYLKSTGFNINRIQFIIVIIKNTIWTIVLSVTFYLLSALLALIADLPNQKHGDDIFFHPLLVMFSLFCGYLGRGTWWYPEIMSQIMADIGGTGLLRWVIEIFSFFYFFALVVAMLAIAGGLGLWLNSRIALELVLGLSSGFISVPKPGPTGILAGSLSGMAKEGLLGALLGGLIGGLIGGVSGWIVGGSTGGLIIGPILFSFGWLVGGVTSGLVPQLICGLYSGLVLYFGLVVIFPWILASSTNYEWDLGTEGIAGTLAYYFIYSRVLFFSFHWFRSLRGVSFYSSPYHNDSLIWLPLWHVDSSLYKQAFNDPDTAIKFIRFLRKYRPLQTKLADRLTHAACAGFWHHHPLQAEYLVSPLSRIEQVKFRPSHDWLNTLNNLREQLAAYQQQTQPSLKLAYFQLFQQQLEAFIDQTQVENRLWNGDYLRSLNLWLKVASDEELDLLEKVKQLEPITRNVYLTGDALRPGMNDAVFLGRLDLKDELSRRVYSAQHLPMFLFQGQRRVGKTSLLNFLEPLLGSGFKVIHQDLQDARVASVPAWLSYLADLINQRLDLADNSTQWNKDDTDWLETWRSFETWLDSIQWNGSYKLILAFDEYEELHNYLQTNPAQGARLLAAMRSFSQRQNQIVFLFVGAALFTELENPNWGQYFVQAQTFRIDYLPRSDAIRLIMEPVKLNYALDLPERMVELTQGHPALLQTLCSEMVNIANQTSKKIMTSDDLDAAVARIVDNSTIAPMDLFWKQFCKEPAAKETIRAIVRGQSATDKKQLNRLREHGFIVQNQSGSWRLRVPLFEQWLTAFDRIDLD